MIVGSAVRFLTSGLQKGDRIVISCGLDLATVVAYLGAMYAGLVPVLLDERMLASYGTLVIAKARAKSMWTRKDVRWAEPGIGRFPADRDACPAGFMDPASVTETDLAALMPTSGSTGVPRLVMVTHRNLTANTEAIIRSQNLSADARAMLIMPISYCFGASVMHTHLYEGGGVVLDSRFMFPDKVLQAINTYCCTTFAGVPAIYDILLRRSNLRSISLPTLRRLLQAGGPLAQESVRKVCEFLPTADFFAMYGQTEATARITCLSIARFPERIGSVGRPLDNINVRIVNEKGQEVAKGQIGEIQVRGPSVCSGYFDDAESTALKFCDGWLKTGDLGCLDDLGCLWIKGRTADFVKIRGVRVSVGEVESRLARVAGVCECAAKGTQHPEAGEALALFIVADGSEDGLVQRVRHELPAQWTCASIELVRELPKTANGKIDRSRIGVTV